MKSMFAAMALAAMSLVPRLVHAADQKMAYVDIQRAVQETEEGKRVFSRLKGEFEKRQKELNARQEELKKLQQDLEKQASVLKPEAREQRQKELEQKFLQLRDGVERMQKELDEKQSKELDRILGRMNTVIAQIAQTEGVTFVINKAGLLYAPPALDLTNEVIRKFNTTGGGGSGGQ